MASHGIDVSITFFEEKNGSKGIIKGKGIGKDLHYNILIQYQIGYIVPTFYYNIQHN